MNRTSHIIRSSFWTFFIATVLSSAIDKVNSVVSGMIVGQSLGPDAVSVVNLAYPILNILKIPSMFVVLGASLLASKAVGERKYDDVRRLFTVTLVFSVGMAFAVALGVLGKVFRFNRNRADVRGEVVAGITAFLAMVCVCAMSPSHRLHRGGPDGICVWKRRGLRRCGPDMENCIRALLR